MANRNVPKLEWATELVAAKPAPTPTTTPLPGETSIDGKLDTLDQAPLRKAGIVTFGQVRDAGDLTSIKGIGQARADKILAIVNGGNPEPPPTAPIGSLKPMTDAFKAIDDALEVSKATIVMSSGYPRLITINDRTYIVIRWGMCTRYTYFLDVLRRQDPRWHAVPPLNNQDTGMIECYDE
jgi:hypothetical protein